MAGSNRPTGRKKRIGSGSTSAFKRGSGVSGKTGGPVGGGYPRKAMKYPKNTGSLGRVSGRRSKFSLATILLIIAVIYMIYQFLSGNSGGLDGLLNGSVQNQVGYDTSGTSNGNGDVGIADTGAYEVNRNVSSLAKDKRTTILGNGKDTVTLMIYLLGTDLESRSGMATADLNEMIKGTISDQVTIIIETGGTSKWQNNIISTKTNQRYKVTNEGLVLLEDNLEKKSMVDPETLSDFIQYSKEAFPADRYQLILWDHGGGSLTGYGYDENFPGEHMTLDEVGLALKKGDTYFDFIGFDACLMATLETAIVLEPYSDYMIASEEVEPGIGWYYTDWITALSKNTSIETIDLGKKIIDDYVAEVQRKTPSSQATLSLIDLAELKATIPDSLKSFAVSTKELIDTDQYKTVSDARANTKEFSKASKLNQIDLIHFSNKVGTKEGKNLAEELQSVVKYNRTSSNINNAFGLSIYFPYNSLGKLDSMLDTYDEIGMDDDYSNVLKSFASVAAGGQVVGNNSGGGNLLGTLLGAATGNSQNGSSSGDMIQQLLQTFISNGDFSSITGLVGNAASQWLDTNAMTASSDYYSENQFDPTLLKITEKNGQKVLDLPEKQWELVQYMEQNVFVDDGEGFIDLGLDNVYEYNDSGDLIMDYDGTWLTLNGQLVSYYLVSEDQSNNDYRIMGRIPAYLNGQEVNIILVFDDANPYGQVLGAQLDYDPEEETSTIAKGLVDIVEGDTIDFICDYYGYDGSYSDSYYLGNQYTATGEWVIENLSIKNLKYQMAYRITDIYNNKFWTPTVTN